MELDDALFQIFRAEVLGYLDVLSSPQTSIVEKIEAAHGLKGASAMVGFDDLSRVAAQLEEQLRQGDETGLQEAVETLQTLLEEAERKRGSAPASDQPEAPGAGQPEHEASQAAGLDADGMQQAPSEPGGHGSPGTGEPQRAERDEVPGDVETRSQPPLQQDMGWDDETAALLRQVFLEEASDHFTRIDEALRALSQDAADQEAIHRLFRATHTIKGAAGTVGLDVVSKAAHSLENLLESYRDLGALPDGAFPVLRRAMDLLMELVEAPPSDQADLKIRLESLLAEAPRQAPTHRTPSSPPTARRPQAESEALNRQAYRPLPERRRGERRTGGRRFSDRKTVRLPIEEVDALLDLLVELIFLRTRIQRRSEEMAALVADLSRTHAGLRRALMSADRSPSDQLLQRMGELEVELSDELSNFQRSSAALTEESDLISQLSRSFQDRLLRLRMEPVGPLMERLRRAARSAAAELGKELDVVVSGEETLLDRVVADRLVDALVHLVRNAVAHGIESPEERLAAGKPRHGTVTLEARQEGDFVLLTVRDDGRGIQWKEVAERAAALGLVSPAEARRATKRQLLQFLFQPGFSTAPRRDSVSGRGVGLDVVQTEVSRMGGEVSVESSEGRGTTFTLRLPVLAAISTALLFKVGGEVYALSLAHVGETCLIPRSDLEQTPPTAKVAGRRLPVLDLARLLGVERKARGRFVPGFLVQWERDLFVLACDKIVGPRQIVVRPMSPILRGLPLYCGATVSGSGKVQLVLDPAGLARALVRMPRAGSAVRPSTVAKVLVVDDSRIIREVLSRILTEAGYDVETAADGWDAWERSLVGDFDALIVDLEMPRLDGYGLIRRLRKMPRFAETPILVLTSRTSQDNRDRAYEAGATVFLTKPVKKALVLRTLSEHLGPREPAAQPAP